jgi:hypothetical protein
MPSPNLQGKYRIVKRKAHKTRTIDQPCAAAPPDVAAIASANFAAAKNSERQHHQTAPECYALRHAILSQPKKESAMSATWKPHEKHGQLTKQSDLPDSVFAFPKQRKEPLTDARHVRNAVARFDQVTGVSDADRASAFANIKKAANHYGIHLSETSWHDLGVHPQRTRKQAAAKAAATRERKEKK